MMKHLDEMVAEIQVSYEPGRISKTQIKTSQDAATLLFHYFPTNMIALQEKAVIMYLNRSNTVLAVYEHSIGGISSTIFDIRLVLATALKFPTSGIILCHNHPSGNSKPSNNDITLTNKIKQASTFFDISLLDHIILTPNEEYLSMTDEGLI